MSPLVYIVMFGWIPAVLLLFRLFSAQRAMIVSFIAALLFLPETSFHLQGIPEYSKVSATCLGALLGTLLYDSKRFRLFRFGWLDIPILIFCIVPIASSISNSLGLYDGMSTTFSQIVTWGFPYFLGRIYLNNLAGLRKVAIGIFIGGLIYVPLCLLEIRISPQLHKIVYGFVPRSDFSQTIRLGGYRPTVFMQHGLWVGMWMMAATLIGIWLWKTEVITRFWDIPVRWLLMGLFITFVLVKSSGAYVYLVLGLIVLFLGRWFATALPLLLLIFSLSSYLYMGVTGTFSGDQIITFLSKNVAEDRASSLNFRFENEKKLSEKARQKPIFGWGTWGRSRIYNEEGKDISTTDSVWIIEFGNKGLVGLICLTTSLLLPVVRFCQLYPAITWSQRKIAPVAVLAVLLVLYMLDCLLNAMVNPIFIFIDGGLSGLVLAKGRDEDV